MVNDTPDQEKYEFLKEKIRYKQALRENSKKIDHQKVRLNIQAHALPSKTFFIMNALAAIIAGYGLLSNSVAVVIGPMCCHDAWAHFWDCLGFNRQPPFTV